MHDSRTAARESMRNPQNLLIVAFHYPPDSSSTGVLRTTKFTHYLADLGWSCHVVSVPTDFYRFIDPESLNTIPQSTTVYRTGALDIKHHFSILGRYPSFLANPDRYWPWIFPATHMGERLISEKNIDAIYTTSPVPSAHLIGWRLKRRCHLPWIADFRDPWVEDSLPWFERTVARFLEKQVLFKADRVICNTPALRRAFLARYPSLPAEKFVVITNGYDEADFTGIEEVPTKAFDVLYAGPVDDENRNPRPFLEAIALCLDRGWLAREDLRITFLGSGASAQRPEFTRDIERMRLRDLVHYEPRLPYRAALARQASASVLVVLNEPLGTGSKVEATRRWTQLCIPAKIFEGLRLRRPMLVLVSGGAAAELIEQSGGGYVIAPDDVHTIAQRLKELYEKRNEPSPVPIAAPEIIARWSRANLTKELAATLAELVKPQIHLDR